MRTRVTWTYSFKLKGDIFPGNFGGFGGFLFRVGFLDRDYAAMMRSVLNGYKTTAEGQPASPPNPTTHVKPGELGGLLTLGTGCLIHPLFRPKSLHGIDGGGAAGRDQRGDETAYRKQDTDQQNRGWIVFANTKEEGFDGPRRDP